MDPYIKGGVKAPAIRDEWRRSWVTISPPTCVGAYILDLA
jgi:hypothetical protein